MFDCLLDFFAFHAEMSADCVGGKYVVIVVAADKVRLYLEGEAKKVGLNAKKLKEICGVGMYAHWFTKSQWELLKEEHYIKCSP